MPGQRHLTQAYKQHRLNLNRGSTLLEQFFDSPGGHPRSQGQPRAHEQELLRSVLVLAVGALDAFLSEMLIELLPKLARVPAANQVFDRLAKDNPGLMLRALYLGGSQQVSSAVEEAVEAQFQGKVMHGSRAVFQVSEWCALGLGQTDFNSEAIPNGLQLLDEWTDKRHRIVHRGELVRLRRADASHVIGLLNHIGKAINDRAISLYG